MTDINNEIDQRKLINMCIKIIQLERENIKTKQFSDKDMRSKIREIIEKEAD